MYIYIYIYIYININTSEFPLEPYYWYDASVTTAAFSINFMGKSLIFNFSKI